MGQSQRPKSCLQARQGAARAAPFGLLLILNPSLRWVPLEPDSTNQGDRSNTMNPSAAGSGRQSKREGGKKESSWDKITSQDRRLRGSGAGSPAQESVPAAPASADGRADAPSLRWEPGEWLTQAPQGEGG